MLYSSALTAEIDLSDLLVEAVELGVENEVKCADGDVCNGMQTQGVAYVQGHWCQGDLRHTSVLFLCQLFGQSTSTFSQSPQNA